MGGMRGAMMGGRMTGAREMAAAGKVWAFNGMADMGDTPLLDARMGDTVRIAMINDTAWPHGMHLHGHHFRQVGVDGRLGPLRDTILMNRGETVEIEQRHRQYHARHGARGSQQEGQRGRLKLGDELVQKFN